MPYVLVSVTDEGVTLLSAESFVSRDAAMVSLRNLMSDAGAEMLREGDIRLLDLDTAAPVLVVEAVPEAEVEPESEPEAEAEAVADVEPEPEAEAVAEVEPEPVLVSEPDPLDVPAVVDVPEIPEVPAIPDEAPPMPPVADEVPVEPALTEADQAEAAVEDDTEDVSESEEPTESEDLSEPDEPTEPEVADEDAEQSLVDALQAAAEQLIADGVPEPEPVGADLAQAVDVEAIAEPAGADADTVAEPMGIPDIEEEAPSAEAEPRRSWPWELEGDGKDASDAAADAPVEDVPQLDETESAVPALEDVTVAAVIQPADVPEAVVEAPDAEPPAGATEPAVVEAVAEEDDSAAKGYEPGALDMEEYTCDDCVYEATCPKKGDDVPATCGSFQWKST